MDDLREYVRRYVPGADPDSYVPVSCTYTTTEDDHYMLDRQGPVVVATGFSGMGFKFVPAIGRILADLATTPDFPAPVFRFRR
jgi:sarcosine oxidase